MNELVGAPMLSVERRKYEQLYAYRAGMLNTAWIAGVARSITPRDGYIQQTNNLNHMIHFVLDEGDVMPYWVKDGVNLKVIGRVIGSRGDTEPIVLLKALALETPSIYDMPPREAWERAVREGIPTDAVRPDVFRPDDETPRMGGLRVADTGNMVKVAGFVSGFFVEPPGVPRPDGGASHGCLVLTLRQTKDRDDLIPVRCYGRNAAPLGAKLKVGVPLRVDGKLRVRLKNTGAPADAAGVLPTHRYPYVHVSILSVTNPADIREEPQWAREMVLEAVGRRGTSPGAGAGTPTAGTGDTSPAPSARPLATSAARVLDADLPIDPTTLQLLPS